MKLLKFSKLNHKTIELTENIIYNVYNIKTEKEEFV